MSAIQSIIIEATKDCKTLTELLMEENTSIRNKDMDVLKDNLPIKDKLASKIMGLLARIKEMRQGMPDDGSLKLHIENLQLSFAEYQTQARKNVLLLRSAHEATASFIDMIRQAVHAMAPKAATYGNNGTVNETKTEENRPTVLSTSV